MYNLQSTCQACAKLSQLRPQRCHRPQVGLADTLTNKINYNQTLSPYNQIVLVPIILLSTFVVE